MNEMTPIFYFTVHPGDMTRGRLLRGCRVMLVAASFWDEERRRFRVRRPPADWVSGFAIDSGGFTAARRWGRYPWTPAQYVGWVREVSRDIPPDFVATMDYACEREVNRGIYPTNRERIEASVANDAALRRLAPDLPWLSVLQGNTLEERAYDLAIRGREGLLPADRAGIGSICGRTPSEARQVIRFYAERLPGVRFHPFGVHVQALDADDVFAVVCSWDTYAWNWGKGQKGVDRPRELLRGRGETWTSYVRRLAEFYWREVVQPRLRRPRQMPLFLEAREAWVQEATLRTGTKLPVK